MSPNEWKLLLTAVGAALGAVGTLGVQALVHKDRVDDRGERIRQFDVQLAHDAEVERLRREDDAELRAYDQYTEARDKAMDDADQLRKDAGLLELDEIVHDETAGKYRGWAAGIIDILTSEQGDDLTQDQQAGEDLDVEELSEGQ